MKVRKLLILIPIVCLLFSTDVFAENMEEQYLNLGSQSERLKASPLLPSSYRSDNEEWAKNIKVKNQKASGLCWSFSTTTAAEYSYSKEYYENTGIVLDSASLSPGHFGYFHYNRNNDALGNTEGDKNKVPDEYDWISYGGNSIYVMQSLANWTGIADEQTYPFSKVESTMDGGNWNGAAPYYRGSELDKDIIVQNSEYFGEFTNDRAKNLILKYGAITSAMFMQDDGTYFNDDRTAYYVFNGGYLNHAVTVIGWDDNYPKENFTHQIPGYSWSYSKDVTTPEGDGAWIIQNSWGNDHEEGKFYISYYSKKSPLYGMVAYDMQPASAYDFNFQYDGSADCGDSSDAGNENFYTDKGTKAANIYKNNTSSPVSVKSVGFTVYNANKVMGKVKVYNNVKDLSNPESGTLSSTGTFVTESAGVKTQELDKETVMLPGDYFSVVFEFSQDTYFGVEKERYRNGFPFDVSVNKGQSFFYRSSWKDMAKYEACFRIKAFATSSGLEQFTLESEYKPTVKNLDYNSNDQEVLTPPKTVPEGYTIYYSVSKSDTYDLKTFSVRVPKVREVGTYYLYYLYKGDAYHLDSKIYKEEIKVRKSDIKSPFDSLNIEVGLEEVKVSDIILPSGWEWSTSDKDKDLLKGGITKATALYTALDKDNYNQNSLSCTINIKRPSGQIIKIIVDELNVRSGPGVDYKKTYELYEGGVYTITEVKDGWGKLKSGIGWINISDLYAQKIRTI